MKSMTPAPLTTRMLSFALVVGCIALTSPAIAQHSLEYPGGPQSRITPAEIRQYEGYANNAKNEINSLLAFTSRTLDSNTLKDKLYQGVKRISRGSQPKEADLLVRHVLYAGLTLSDLIDRETSNNAFGRAPQGTVDQQVRILRHTLTMAQDYFEPDAVYIQKLQSGERTFSRQPQFVEFGTRLTQFMIKMSDGVLDASASYGMIRWSMGVLANYLHKDRRATVYAGTIRDLFVRLQDYPDLVNGDPAPADLSCIRYVQELKLLAQLSLGQIKTQQSLESKN